MVDAGAIPCRPILGVYTVTEIQCRNNLHLCVERIAKI